MTKGGKPDKVNRVKGGPNRNLDTLMELQMNKVWNHKEKYFEFYN